MPNPVTRKILDDLRDPALSAFVEGWDDLEELVISVFRTSEATRAQRRMYHRLRKTLVKGYEEHRDALFAYWPEAQVAGEKALEDPFLALLSVERASQFIENWQAMQTLPAVRESINGWLVDQLGDQ